tara:strand:+ start:26642 stop:28030 length:1389 start_codon:yes stop_codon:yes gene_type:complete
MPLTSTSTYKTSSNESIYYGDITTSAFKGVFRKSTPFLHYQKYLNYDGNIDPSNLLGQKNVLFKLQPWSDLIGNILVEVKIKGQADSSTEYSVNHFGNTLLKEVIFKIGGNKIDRHTSRWLQIEKELHGNHNDEYNLSDTSDTTNGGLQSSISVGTTGYRNKISEYNKITGDCPLVFGSGSTTTASINTDYYKTIYIPLRFFCNKNIGQLLPIKALHKSDVEIVFELETLANLKGSLKTLSITSFKLLVDYYSLGKEESLRFRTNKLSYVIDQVQENATYKTNNSVKTTFFEGNTGGELEESRFEIQDFQNKVKYITWVVNDKSLVDAGTGPCYFKSLCDNSEYGDNGYYGTFKLDIDASLPNHLYELPMSYCTRITHMKNNKGKIPLLDRIGLYSFSFNPFGNDIAGFYDFKSATNKSQNIHLKIANNKSNTITDKNIFFYAVSYNILEISDGYGCLALPY